MGVKKLSLDISAMEDDFFSSSALIGITSALSATKLCWLLHQKLDIHFVRCPELDICTHKPGEQAQFFSLYEYQKQSPGSRNLLYKLKNNEQHLLPEIKQLDYLWMIQGENAINETDIFIKQLRNMPEIQLAQVLQPDRIKNINYLLL